MVNSTGVCLFTGSWTLLCTDRGVLVLVAIACLEVYLSATAAVTHEFGCCGVVVTPGVGVNVEDVCVAIVLLTSLLSSFI